MGCDADLVVWNPEAEFSRGCGGAPSASQDHALCGAEARGLVEATFLRGQKIYDRGDFPRRPLGQVLRRGEA